MEGNWAGLRLEYRRGRLLENEVDPDPFVTFAAWYQATQEAELYEPNGMTLATVGADGRPSARIVLLRKVDERGFCFFTNYESRKGHELAANPWAALLFWWGRLERQVRIEGQVERLSDAESDAYYREPSQRQPLGGVGFGTERGDRQPPSSGREASRRWRANMLTMNRRARPFGVAIALCRRCLSFGKVAPTVCMTVCAICAKRTIVG